MSEQVLDPVHVPDAPEAEKRHHGLGGGLAIFALSVGALTLPGAAVGWWGVDSAHADDRATLQQHEAAVPAEQARLQTARQTEGTYLGSLSAACSDVITSYLPGGINQGIDSAHAQISVQLTGACSEGDTKSVTIARHNAQVVDTETARLTAHETRIANEKKHLAHNNDLLDAMLIGAAAEVALYWGVEEWANLRDGWQPAVLYQLIETNQEWIDSHPLQKTINFWKKHLSTGIVKN